MARIVLDWDEAAGHLPMVCAFCGRRAVELVTTRQRAYGRAAFPLPAVRYVSANITLPRCDLHQRSRPHLFAAHAAHIRDDGVVMKFVSSRFVEAVEDLRIREGRRRPPRADRSLVWLWVLLGIFGSLLLGCLVMGVVLILTMKVRTGPTEMPKDPWKEFEKKFPTKIDGPRRDLKEEFERRVRERKGIELAPLPRLKA